MYKTSPRQVFHLNSKSQICHKLILQVISHQIKDNMHNHRGSIGLFEVGPVGDFGFGCFGLFFLCEQENRHKALANNLNGRSFPIPSCLDQVIIIFSFLHSLPQPRRWFRCLFIPKNYFSFLFPFSFSLSSIFHLDFIFLLLFLYSIFTCSTQLRFEVKEGGKQSG